MADKKNSKLIWRELSPDDSIFKSGFVISPITLKQKSIQNLFFEKIDKSSNRSIRLKNLVNTLFKHEWRLKN